MDESQANAAALTYLMVGGGPGSFIGAVHKAGMDMFGQARLVGGVFSRSPDKNKQRAQEWRIDPGRVYENYHIMLEREAARKDRPDFVVIVTPNNSHFPVAKAALEQGFHIASDKPLTVSLDEALELARLAEQQEREFLVTYTYLGYPLVRQAREMVAEGLLGTIRVLGVEYLQGWLADEARGNAQASWRVDPATSGPVGSLGDIGTHAESLAHYIAGKDLTRLSARLDTFVSGRQLDDNNFVMFEMGPEVRGSIWASQVAVGCENNLSIKIFGDKAGLEWHQLNPNQLFFTPKDQPAQILTRGQPYLHPHAARYTHIPSGHPEGLIEAFANLYAGFIHTIQARRAGTEPSPFDWYPSVLDGVKGMRFIDASLRSNAHQSAWVDV